MSSIANQQVLEPIFEMIGVDVFRDGIDPWFVNTLMQCISCVKVASNFLLSLSVKHVGRMNTQVRLLNS